MVTLLPNTGGAGWGGASDKIIYTFMNDVEVTQTGPIVSKWNMRLESYYAEVTSQNPHIANYYLWHGNLVLTGTDFTSDSTDNFLMGILFK